MHLTRISQLLLTLAAFALGAAHLAADVVETKNGAKLVGKGGGAAVHALGEQDDAVALQMLAHGAGDLLHVPAVGEQGKQAAAGNVDELP